MSATVAADDAGLLLNPTAMNDSIASVDEWQANLAVGEEAEEDTVGAGAAAPGQREAPGDAAAAAYAGRFSLEYDGGYAGLLGDARDAAGLLEWRQQVLFRGMRVRMSVATGYVDTVRVHSVTKRREYQGDVLKKVQAVGEAPHGGQVSVWEGQVRGGGGTPGCSCKGMYRAVVLIGVFH
jgi:hypothetical protein